MSPRISPTASPRSPSPSLAPDLRKKREMDIYNKLNP